MIIVINLIIFQSVLKMVMGVNCPNIEVCLLVITTGFGGDESKRQEYINSYCKSGEMMWGRCTRYVVKNKLNFCPDFVLPDTDMTPDEVIDKFDEENNE